MEYSARNVYEGKVVNYNSDSISAQVFLELTDGRDIVASISRAALDNMGVKEGMELKVLIKAPDVIISKNVRSKISARNAFEGRIEEIQSEKIHSEVVLNIGHGLFLTSVLSTDSLRRLDIKVGDVVEGVIKSNNVVLSK